MADTTLSRSAHAAAIGLLLAHNDAQEGRLAAAVWAKQPSPVAGIEDEVDAFEDDVVAVCLGDIADL